MTNYEFDIPGPPVPKERPRIGRASNVYTPKPTADYEQWIMVCALQNKVRCITGDVSMAIDFHLSANRGDIDNYSKAILDGLQGVAYRNDNAVVTLTLRKLRCAKGDERAHVTICPA